MLTEKQKEIQKKVMLYRIIGNHNKEKEVLKSALSRYPEWDFAVKSLRELNEKILSDTPISDYNQKLKTEYLEIIGNINPLTKNKICIFAHFDLKNTVADYVVYWLKSLYEFDCSVFFVTTSEFLDDPSIEKIKPYVSYILIRPNIGSDWGSYCVGFEKSKSYIHHDMLIFANDTMFGPFYPLKNLDNFFSQESVDVFGFADNYFENFTSSILISFFLVCKKRVFSSFVFKNFFHKFSFSDDKWFIVTEHEVGFSKMLLNHGFNLKALCGTKEINQFLGEERSIQLFHNWKISVQNFKCPIIKKKLFREEWKFQEENSNTDKTYMNAEFKYCQDNNFFFNPNTDWDVIKQTGYNTQFIEDYYKQT